MDRLSGIYALFVTFVGLLIHILRDGLYVGRQRLLSLFRLPELFMFSMLTLVLADNFLLMFVGWEGVGLCSYLLIGYYIQLDEARRAAKKAFVMNRIGDWGVLMGIVLIFTLTGSISFYDKVVDGAKVRQRFTIVANQCGRRIHLGRDLRGG
jgi:NADH-quinone oxidoreductase subunit L